RMFEELLAASPPSVGVDLQPSQNRSVGGTRTNAPTESSKWQRAHRPRTGVEAPAQRPWNGVTCRYRPPDGLRGPFPSAAPPPRSEALAPEEASPMRHLAPRQNGPAPHPVLPAPVFGLARTCRPLGPVPPTAARPLPRSPPGH